MHDFPALLSQPQELDMLGTLQALLCFYIEDIFDVHINSVNFDASPKGIFSNTSLGCNWTLESWLTSGISAIAFPLDLFLKCRECIWKGVPGRAVALLANWPCFIQIRHLYQLQLSTGSGAAHGFSERSAIWQWLSGTLQSSSLAAWYQQLVLFTLCLL